VVITQGEGFNNFWINCYVPSVDGDEEE